MSGLVNLTKLENSIKLYTYREVRNMQETNKEDNWSPDQCSFIQIYYDCKTIISLFKSMRDNSIACMELIPYISLFCWEAISFLENIGIKINIKENETISLKDVRLKLKNFEREY